MQIHFILVLALFSVGCVTHIKPSAVENSPPSEKFSAFGRFELQRVSLSPSYSDDDANQRAAAKIQEYFNERVSPIIDGWNRAAPQGQQARVMVIEPRIEHLKFIGGATRFWVGPIAGSSAVLSSVRETDTSDVATMSTGVRCRSNTSNRALRKP